MARLLSGSAIADRGYCLIPSLVDEALVPLGVISSSSPVEPSASRRVPAILDLSAPDLSVEEESFGWGGSTVPKLILGKV